MEQYGDKEARMRWFGHVLRRDTVRILYIQTKGVKDLTARRYEKVRLSRGFMDVVMKGY